MDFSLVEASGGILTMWDFCVFSMEYKVIDRNFVGVVGSWSGVSCKILFGDFNIVRSQDERLGSFFDVIEANPFNDFIARVGVFDVPIGGKRFTKFDKNGRMVFKISSLPLGLSRLCIHPWSRFKNKLKRLRHAIKAWTSNQIEAHNNLKDGLFRQLLGWDERAEQGLIDDEDVAKREVICVTNIHKKTKTKPKRTKPSTGLEEHEKMKPRTYLSL
ncbi:hypothetical protein Tco_0289299 [Tanacetum coccineum]